MYYTGIIILKIAWIKCYINVLKRAGVNRKLLKVVKKRQLKFFDQVMKKDGIENLTVTGKIEE